MIAAYYNEIDPEKAAWIRELITAKVVAAGEVDERDIKLVQPEDLRGYRQCHFFAGIGVWSLALRRAGWPRSFSREPPGSTRRLPGWWPCARGSTW